MNISPTIFRMGIITILLITIAIFFAGCTGSAPQAPSAATPQITGIITKTTTSPAVTTARQQAAIVPVEVTENPARVFAGDFNWVEYQNIVSQTMAPNPRSSWVYTSRMERSTGKYKGNPAIHYKVTTISDYPECCIDNKVTITKDGRVAVEDTYYDASTNRFLGGSGTETIKGVLQPPGDSSAYYTEHRREEQPRGEMGIEPFGEMNITLADRGTESVKVPAGTYPDAHKYTGNFLDGTPITFWVVPGIPVPVQYQFPNKNLEGEDPFQSFELTGWG